MSVKELNKRKEKDKLRGEKYDYVLKISASYDIQANSEYQAIVNLCHMLRNEANRIMDLKESARDCWGLEIIKC